MRGEWKLLLNRSMVFVWGDEKVLQIDSNDSCTTLSI